MSHHTDDDDDADLFWFAIRILVALCVPTLILYRLESDHEQRRSLRVCY